MKTEYHHIVTIFRKIDPSKRYYEFTYTDEGSFQSALFGAKKGDIFKIDDSFYIVDKKDKYSPLKIIPNMIIKHGRHVIKQEIIC